MNPQTSDLPDYYQVLGVVPDASMKDIQQAYVKWVKFLPSSAALENKTLAH
jgi:preprotein translocase subunit Sec63